MTTKTIEANSDKEWVEKYQKEYGEIEYGRSGFTYHTFNHEDWDSILAVPADDDVFASIRQFVEEGRHK